MGDSSAATGNIIRNYGGVGNLTSYGMRLIAHYVAERRLTVAHQHIVLTDQPVQEVAETVGFSNPAHFATAFRRRFGPRPPPVRCLAYLRPQCCQRPGTETAPKAVPKLVHDVETQDFVSRR